MTSPTRIYLDNAATSWPKPPGVSEAVRRYLDECGAPAGRGIYRAAIDAERIVSECRQRLARLLGIAEPRRIIFTANGTDSLNLALHGWLRPGDHVVTTVLEHNSVLRPLRFLEERRGVEVTRVGCDRDGRLAPADLLDACRRHTRLIAVTHASNVTGTIQPLEEILEKARAREVPLLVDAAQSLGHVELNLSRHPCLLASSAHKGLLGPLGLGILYVGPGFERELEPLRQGGTGTRSEDDRQPDTLPERYEAGNLNVPAIAGLRAALEYLERQTWSRLRTHEVELTQQLVDGLRELPGVTVLGPQEAGGRVGVVSVIFSAYEPQEVAAMLDAAHSIQVRSGLHCAPLAHRALGTLSGGGTVRFSLGPFTTAAEIERTLQAVAELAGSAL